MLSLLLAFLAMPLMVAAFLKSNSLLSLASAGFWVVFGIFARTQSQMSSTGNWDIWYALFYLGVFLGLVCIFAAIAMRPKKKDRDEGLDDDPLSDVDSIENEYDGLAAQTRIPRINPRSYNRRRVTQKGGG